METLPALAVESFSYSWLSNAKSPSDGLDYESLIASLDSSSEALFKELDHKSFDFDIPISHSPIPINHADELFSDGLIKPIFVKPSELEASDIPDSISAMPVSSFSSSNVVPDIQVYCHFLGRWRKSSGRVLQKCFRNLSLLCRRARSSRKSTRVDDIDRRQWEAKIWKTSPQASPRRSTAYLRDDLCHMESSIHEAVLHCKRSIEK